MPNLVETVKGFAAQEQAVLLGVTNARAKVGSIQATPELVNDPQAFAQFQQAQGELTSALSRLMVVVENYPQLKSDQNFRDLQAQLEGTENRITVARNRYIKAVQEYNTTRRAVPDQPDRDDLRLQGEAAVHGREREGDPQAAEGRLQRRSRRRPPKPSAAMRDSPTKYRPAACARLAARCSLAVAARGRARSPCRRCRRASPISPAR